MNATVALVKSGETKVRKMNTANYIGIPFPSFGEGLFLVAARHFQQVVYFLSKGGQLGVQICNLHRMRLRKRVKAKFCLKSLENTSLIIIYLIYEIQKGLFMKVTIQQETFERLQRHTEPLVDDVDSVLNRVLDAYEQQLDSCADAQRNSGRRKAGIDRRTVNRARIHKNWERDNPLLEIRAPEGDYEVSHNELVQIVSETKPKTYDVYQKLRNYNWPLMPEWLKEALVPYRIKSDDDKGEDGLGHRQTNPQNPGLPDLGGTSILTASVNGKALNCPLNWTRVLESTLVEAMVELESIEELRRCFPTINIRTEDLREEHSFFYIEEIGISVRYAKANVVAQALRAATERLRIPVEVRFEWRPPSPKAGQQDQLRMDRG